MAHAFAFVDVSAGDAGKLPAMLSQVESVTEAHVVAGDYDVVVELKDEEVYDLLSTVTEAIRPLDGVERTRTYVALE